MAFNFTAASATGSAAVGAISGSVTPWYRLSDRIAANSFILAGTFVGTVTPEYSNSPGFDKDSDYVQDTGGGYSAPSLLELPLGIADFVRYRCTAYTSGTPKLSHARALGAESVPFTIPEDTKKTPAPSSLGS